MIDYFSEVKKSINNESFFESMGFSFADAKRTPRGEYFHRCLFHNDKTASLSINLEKGFYKCFGCTAKGDIFNLYEDLYGVSKYEALVAVADFAGIKIEVGPKRRKIDTDYPVNCHNFLLEQPSIIEALFDAKGITLETIKKYQIGWCSKEGRYTIPVYENRSLVNIRLYKLNASKKDIKIFSYFVYKTKEEILSEEQAAIKSGKDIKSIEKKWAWGENRVYGYDEILDRPNDPIYFVEGETDKLLLSQKGYLSACNTAGCNSWSIKYNKLFKDRDVVLVYDMDSAGRTSVLKRVQDLERVVKTLKNVALPLEGTPEENDICDYFVKRKFTDSDFTELIEQAKIHDPKKIDPLEPEKKVDDEEIIELSCLRDIATDEHIGKLIAVDFRVTGTVHNNFIVPQGLKLRIETCKVFDKCKYKDRCARGMTLSHKDREYYGSCNVTDHQKEAMLRKKYCVFNRKDIIIDIITKKTMREFHITDVINSDIVMKEKDFRSELNSARNTGASYRLYYDGKQDVGYCSHRAIGYVSDHPKNQSIVLSASELIPIKDDWERFTLDAETIKELDRFRSLDGFYDVAQDISNHVTRINGREDILILMLLTYMSPLYINFNGEEIIGTFNIVIIGDSGTGKSVTFTRLQDFIGIGELVRGESSTRTGLVYGLKKNPIKGWEIKVGVYIQASRKLLCIDEAQKISKDDMRYFNQGIDQGKIRIEQIESATIPVVTRLICIANPKDNKTLNSERRPCLALKGIFDETFIRRIDAFGFCSSGDFDIETEDKEGFTLLNRPNQQNLNQKVTQKMLRSLVYLMWNIKSENIKFNDDARDECLKRAGKMAKKYGNAYDLLIVNSGDIRNAIAKASVSVAALDGSFNNNFTELYVTKEHVIGAVKFLDNNYKMPNCKLNSYSNECRDRNNVTKEEYDLFKRDLTELINKEKHTPNLAGSMLRLMGILYNNDPMNRREICDFLNIETAEANKRIRFLAAFNLISTDFYGKYKGSPKFNTIIDMLQQENFISEESLRLSYSQSEEVYE